MAAILVIIPDVLSDIINKGEITPRYYNPGNLFEEVHILMTNNDKPDPQKLQSTVGNAKLFLHNIPLPSSKRTLGYKSWLLKIWASPAVKLAKKINPTLIRCHGNWFNGFLASRIKNKLGIPYVVSLHTQPEDFRRETTSAFGEKNQRVMDYIEEKTLHNANIILPVYESLLPYLEKKGYTKYEVAYNVLNGESLKEKKKYTLHNPISLISVGRHFRGKNPENIIRAIKKLPDVHLTLIGDGPYQDDLQRITQECCVENRVLFLKAINNDELCNQLSGYDIFAVHNDYWGIPKAVMESLLTGLPVITNHRIGKPVEELQGDHVLLVENTPEGYREGLKKLIEDHKFREQLGKRAYEVAQERWAPAKTEAKYVEIYKRVMAQAGN